jgi:hypothetical protein
MQIRLKQAQKLIFRAMHKELYGKILRSIFGDGYSEICSVDGLLQLEHIRANEFALIFKTDLGGGGIVIFLFSLCATVALAVFAGVPCGGTDSPRGK